MERLTYQGTVNALLKSDKEPKSYDSVCLGCEKLTECVKAQKECNLFDAIERLAAYEDTGITPEEIMDGRMLTGWIPVDERLPECEKEVFIQTARGTITTAIYEDGKMSDDNSIWHWSDVDFDYDEETDTEYVPEGWREYRHYNPDDVYNNLVDEEVIAWMTLPERYKADK